MVLMAGVQGKNRSAGLARRLRKTCGFFFVRPRGRRSPAKAGVALRYIRCLVVAYGSCVPYGAVVDSKYVD